MHRLRNNAAHPLTTCVAMCKLHISPFLPKPKMRKQQLLEALVRVTKETCRVSNANARKLFAMLAEMDPTLNLLKAQLCVEGPTIEKTC